MTVNDRHDSDRWDEDQTTDQSADSSPDPTLPPDPAAALPHAESTGDWATLDPPARENEEEETLPPDAGSSGQVRATPNREPRHVGDYELLDEIARGGMGVVYRARHRKLNRFVALKLVLAGQFASPEAITRFHLEAEAAAGLDHPGITPIYDIGEYEGQPFFAMKLITGGSVESRIESFEQKPREAAGLVSKVARAIQHAHERGVLHRDLKPNNILLDETQQPLVTDFGLAKMVDRDSDHTRTGAIMGTPGYMAPEQAAGNKGTTTASDVYGLGAILYRLLTGRPTYMAESALDIVMMSLSEDPPAPRSITPGIPQDLELICMKCLARDPHQRYHSAAELADDLDRWLQGEAVSVRPASMSTVAGIWMRQNLQMAGTAALVGSGFGLLLAATMYFSAFSGNFRFAAETYSEYFPSEKPPLLAVAWRSPDWMFFVGLAVWPSLVALCGLVTVLMTKPPTRHAAASVGMIAGMFCGGWMGMTGTLGPIMSQTTRRTEKDVRLLVQAAESDADQNRFAQLAILFNYPDLERFNEAERAELLRRKITGDTIAGIPLGLWLGMAIFMSAVPAIVAGSIFAWRLTRENKKRARVWYRYLDVSLAFCILLTFAILFLTARPLGANIFVPSIGQATFTLAILLVAFIAALIPWRWYARLPIHVAWLSCVILYVQQTDEASQAYVNAGPAALEGDYHEALEHVRTTISVSSGNPWLLLLSGTLEAKLGLTEAYQRTSDEFTAIALMRTEPDTAGRAAKICMLSPEQREPSSVVIQLAEKAMVLGKNHRSRKWFQLCHAMSQFRCGRWQAAIEASDQIDRRNSWFLITCTADVIKAMALGKQGHTQAAIQLMDQAQSRFDDRWTALESDPVRHSIWHDKLIYEIWRDQARGQLSKTKPPGGVIES